MSARLERSSRTPAFLLAAVLATAACARAPEGPPNFVLICVDTLRADHLGYAGYARATSPRIDALAAQGARFRGCFSTYPQTAASIASLFTSLPPSAHKKMTEAETTLTSSVPLLAKALRGGGYRTAAVATNPHLSPGLGYEQGFERFTYVSGKKRYSLFEATREYAGTVVDVRSSEADAYGRGDAVNRAALEWLDGSADARPFFLYLHYMDVHSPYESPAPYHAMFVEQEGRDRYCNGVPRRPVKPADVQYMRALYDGQIRYLDGLLGELLDALGERGLLERTYLVLVADHGEEFLEHGGFGHGETLYREMLHVPLLVVGPRVRARVEEAVVSTLDLYPTLCELAGIAVPAHVQGSSLVPLLEGTGAPARVAFAECIDARIRGPGAPSKTRKTPGHAVSLVDGEWHLIHRPADGHTELYRHGTDPREASDQSATHPEVVARLRAEAERLWRASLEAGSAIETEEIELDPASQQQLEDLGYAGEEESESDESEE
jgi:arylsulfatase A-like enzyme